MKYQNHIKPITLQEVAEIKSEDRLRRITFEMRLALRSAAPSLEEAAERIRTALQSAAIKMGKNCAEQVNERIKKQLKE